MAPSGGALDASVCSRCGHANLPGSRFCSNCGNPLVSGQRPTEVTSTIAFGAFDSEPSGETGEVPAYEESAVASLVVRRGPNAGSRFPLETEVTTAGRSQDSEIFLDDVTVSRRHAEFYRNGGRFTVRDVGSLNGTYVNRERIEETSLSGGDEVQIGKFRLVFLLGPRSQAEHGGGGSRVGG
jgi:pSer/pThr/pTyr-binding forkhead associated (FHA) protein